MSIYDYTLYWQGAQEASNMSNAYARYGWLFYLVPKSLAACRRLWYTLIRCIS